MCRLPRCWGGQPDPLRVGLPWRAEGARGRGPGGGRKGHFGHDALQDVLRQVINNNRKRENMCQSKLLFYTVKMQW